ncbi:tribbles homolog 2 [Nasonia vitripennis]|uniref:Protein kinase domain-containing protein n=1 Tax=Nasonia vitripennis TaxID=7425 RepID=A0A7M7QHF6_NASVI|nr:tribbles homolog 2 [Nasonia vitripennis]XP_031786832.1 tribbles homolog 2 [Nasonia vitripennis]
MVNMRVATRHQQPMHLQVTRTNNGKFLVSPNSSPDHHHQHQQPHHHRQHHQHHQHHQHRHHHHSQPVAAQQPQGAEDATPAQQVNATAGESHGPTILGDRFLLVAPAEGSTLFRCVDVHTGQQLVAKALTLGDRGAEALLQAHLRLEGTGAVSAVAGLVDAGKKRYLLLEGHHGDLHAYVRARRRLREPEARRLFRQAARAVATCHENGVVLRDLKLRKFVFADEARTKLRLESLEDAVLVEEDDDKLSDRRGCPAYVAPEVLRSGRAYSGKAADIWSLGVLLYTMLVGRYPFNDAEHASLFAKISRGQFAVPEALTPRARCLVKALLRREPSERPLAEDVLRHPWLSKPLRQPSSGTSLAGCHASARSHSSPAAPGSDQLVPELRNVNSSSHNRVSQD